MEIVLNGASKSLEGSVNLLQLLDLLGLKADRCAIELNRQLVARANWDATSIQQGDVLEIVQFVGGG
ncbi:MAG TPA: sulfur carrier protein ThiS [Candidatus Saccharimonadales bacterium]|nr:sulfur carrier protein ThiS [Candidatus Saccharimonadales bacterium]